MHVTVSTITEAVADVMKAATLGGIVDQTLAARISGEIAPALQKALTSPVGSGAELSGLSVFRNILNQHLATPASPYIEAESRKAMQRTLETANRTGSEFASLTMHAGTRGLASNYVQRERDAHGSGERISAAMTRDMPLSVAGAVSFAKELGIGPGYASLFAGGSHEMRDALRDAITNGKAITDDKVKSMQDVGMVLGAIRAGKLKSDDPRIPQSVKQVIEDMKAKGIDPSKADTKAIQKYLKDNPKALDKARQQDQADKKASDSLTTTDKKHVIEAGPKKAKAAAKPQGTASL